MSELVLVSVCRSDTERLVHVCTVSDSAVAKIRAIEVPATGSHRFRYGLFGFIFQLYDCDVYRIHTLTLYGNPCGRGCRAEFIHDTAA